MCSHRGKCCGGLPVHAVINQPPDYLWNQAQRLPLPSSSKFQPLPTCGGFGIANCLPTCCPHPRRLCQARAQSNSLQQQYCPPCLCPCPILSRCAGECCPRHYCGPPFMTPFV